MNEHNEMHQFLVKEVALFSTEHCALCLEIIDLQLFDLYLYDIFVLQGSSKACHILASYIIVSSIL